MEKINEIEINKRKYTIYKLNQEETTETNNGYKIIPAAPLTENDGEIIPPNEEEKYYTVNVGDDICKLHRVIYCAYTKLQFDTFGKQIHHINENKTCNKIENLIGLSKEEHFLYHTLKRKAIEYAENKKFMEAQEFFYQARKILQIALKKEMGSTKLISGTAFRTELYLDKGFKKFQERHEQFSDNTQKSIAQDLETNGFKEIPFANVYLINSNGTIYNTITQKTIRPRKVRAPKQTNDFYMFSHPGLYCKLQIQEGLVKPYEVGYLVALLFLPNPNNKKRIGYKDKDWFNISVNNLYWY